MHATRPTRAEQCDGLTESYQIIWEHKPTSHVSTRAASGTLHDLSSSIRQALLKHATRRARAEQWGAVALQIAKLLIIPFVCAVESVWLGKVFSRSVIGSIVTVVAGVAIV